MQKSESIAKLSAALSQVQLRITGAPKESVNPHYRSAYADLATCWESLRQPLSENGLAVFQTFVPCLTGVQLITMLSHTSGEWVCSELYLPVVKQDPQAYGSAITYARRYALCAIVGLYQVDDDANHAVGKHDDHNTPPTARAALPGPIAALPVATTKSVKGPSEAQVKRFYGIQHDFGWSTEQTRAVLVSKYRVERVQDLDWKQYKELCDVILPAGPQGDIPNAGRVHTGGTIQHAPRPMQEPVFNPENDLPF